MKRCKHGKICVSSISIAFACLLVVTACGGGSGGGSGNDDNTSGGTSDSMGTDGGTTNSGSTDGDGSDNGGTTGGSTDNGSDSSTDSLTIIAYNNSLDMTPLQGVNISVYGDDDRTITQTQQTNEAGTVSFADATAADGLVTYTVFFEGEPGIDGSFITFIDSEPGPYVFFADSDPECQPVATLNLTVAGATTGNFATVGPLIADGTLGGGSVAINNGTAIFPNATVCSDDLEAGNVVTLVPIESTGTEVVAYTVLNNVAAADASLTSSFDMPAVALNWSSVDPVNAPDFISASGIRSGVNGSIPYSLLGLANTTGATSGSFMAVGAFPGDFVITAVRGMEEACAHVENHGAFPATVSTDIPSYQLANFGFNGATRTFDVNRSDTINADLHQITTFFARSTGFAGDEIQWNFFVPPGRVQIDIPDQPVAIAATFDDTAIDIDRTTLMVSDLISGDGSLNLDGFNAINAAFADGGQTNDVLLVDRRSCNFNLVSSSNTGDGSDTNTDGGNTDFGSLALSGSASSSIPSTSFNPVGPGFQNSATIVWTTADGSQIFLLSSGGSGASLVTYTPGSGALASIDFQAQVAFGSNVAGLNLTENMANFSGVVLSNDGSGTIVVDGAIPFTDTLQ